MAHTIMTAKITGSSKQEEQFDIHIDGKATQQEVEFVLVRSMYMLIQRYCEDSGTSFEEALSQYKEAIGAQIGAMHDHGE